MVLRGEELDSTRLDHAYASTVHRAQGARVDRADVYADGGGRELTNVALSRARHETTIRCVADNLDQAIEDLHRDWNHDRRQRWTIDTDLPAAPGQPTRPALMPDVDAGLRLGRLRAERDAMPADPDPTLLERIQDQRVLTRHLYELCAGIGRYTNTAIGQAAQDHVAAQAAYDQAARHARSCALGRWQERKANRLV